MRFIQDYLIQRLKLNGWKMFQSENLKFILKSVKNLILSWKKKEQKIWKDDSFEIFMIEFIWEWKMNSEVNEHSSAF